MILGALLMTTGMALTAFVSNVNHLFVTFGFLAGKKNLKAGPLDSNNLQIE